MTTLLLHKRGQDSRKGAHAEKHIQKKKENVSEGVCKAGLLGHVSSQRPLGQCFFKKNPAGREMLSLESSPHADQACDSGCHLSPVRECDEEQKHPLASGLSARPLLSLLPSHR